MSSTITTLAGLLHRVALVLDGEQPDPGNLTVETLTTFLRVAERRIYRDVRSRFNERAFAGVTATGNLAPIPVDYKAPSEVYIDGKALEPVAANWLREYIENGASGEARYYAEVGGNLKFGPALSDGTSVAGRYFYEMPALTDATIAANALFQEADDLFIYATLLECAVYFNKVPMLPAFQEKYGSIVSALNRHSAQAAYSSGRMRRRPSTHLMR